jgi:hypothetical protein
MEYTIHQLLDTPSLSNSLAVIDMELLKYDLELCLLYNDRPSASLPKMLQKMEALYEHILAHPDSTGDHTYFSPRYEQVTEAALMWCKLQIRISNTFIAMHTDDTEIVQKEKKELNLMQVDLTRMQANYDVVHAHHSC